MEVGATKNVAVGGWRVGSKQEAVALQVFDALDCAPKTAMQQKAEDRVK